MPNVWLLLVIDSDLFLAARFQVVRVSIFVKTYS